MSDVFITCAYYHLELRKSNLYFSSQHQLRRLILLGGLFMFIMDVFKNVFSAVGLRFLNLINHRRSFSLFTYSTSYISILSPCNSLLAKSVCVT